MHQLRVTKRQEAVLHSQERGAVVRPDRQHDRDKERLLPEEDPVLRELGISGAEGRVKASRRAKYRQVEEFLRLLDATVADALAAGHLRRPTAADPLRVVDLGCGNAYLTFAAHRFLTARRGLPVAVTGVDTRQQSHDHNSELAGALAADARFVVGSIAEARLEQPPEVVLALHACDTATDEALARAVEWAAPVVLAAPCCHHDVAAQLRRAPTPAPYAALTRDGILRERFADTLTDALRSLLMRRRGYRVDVVQFVESRHTPRNTMLRAVRTGASAGEEVRAGVRRAGLRLVAAAPPRGAARRGRVGRGVIGLREAGVTALLALPFSLGAAAGPAAQEGRELCRVTDQEVVEASGLVATASPPEGVLVTVNDSGDEGRVFALDAGSCATVGVTRWAEEPEDVEALAPGPVGRTGDTRGVWVGDIGDNPGTRSEVRVGLVPVAEGDRDASPQWTALRYPDGPRDAEALLRHPGSGRLVVVSKRVVGGAFYAVPDRVAPGEVGEMRRLGAAPSLVTDGAFWPDGRHLVLRNYARATVYSWPGLDQVAAFPLPAQPQGEALAVTPDGRVLVASEGRDQPVLEVRPPADVRAVLEGDGEASPAPGGDESASPTPAVPGEAAGPATTDREEGLPWPGMVLAAGGVLALLAAGAYLGRRPGG